MMDRKTFIKTCGFTCLSLTGLSAVLQSCTGTKYVQSHTAAGKLSIARADFFKDGDTAKKAKHYIIVKADSLDYPVVVYRNAADVYTALLLQCTHQSMELNVSGDLLTCPAHGSEFNSSGAVVQGPAEQHLKQYPVTQDQDNIYIHLA